MTDPIRDISALHDILSRCDISLRSKKREEAKALVMSQIPAYADDCSSLFLIADYLRKCEDQEGAMTILGRLTNHEDFHIRLRSNLEVASIMIHLGQIEEASEMLWKAHYQEPTNVWPIKRLIDIAEQSEDISLMNRIAKIFSDWTDPVATSHIYDHLLKAKAMRAFKSGDRRSGWKPKNIVDIPILRSAGLVTMVKNEADIIHAMLSHHYSLGMRYFCIFENGSTDETLSEIYRFRNANNDAVVLILQDPVVTYFQKEKMAAGSTLLNDFASMLGLDLSWIFYLDADEFLAPIDVSDTADPKAAFENALADVASQVLVFHWIHGTSLEVYEETPVITNVFDVFPKFETRLKTVVSKVALRPGFRPNQGNHGIEGPAPSISAHISMASLGWFIFHFPMRSARQYGSKIITGMAAHQNAPQLAGYASHWREYYRQFQIRGDIVFREIVQSFISGV